jgi:hypothetical protein
VKWILILLMLAALVLGFAQTALAADKTEWIDYKAAWTIAQQADKPLVVLVGAEWCQPCKQVQSLYGGQLATRGAYVHLDVDKHRDVILKIAGRVPPVPVLIVWHRVHHAWQPPKQFFGPEQIGLYLRESLP